MPETRVCTKCGLEKDMNRFYWTNRRNGERARHSVCKECRKAQFKEWAKTQTGKKRQRMYLLKSQYGLTEDEYDQMFRDQEGICAICRQPEFKRHGRANTPLMLSVDHDHVTGEIRGLLCSACNMALGAFRDSPEFLRNAATYLERWFARDTKRNSESGEQAAGTQGI